MVLHDYDEHFTIKFWQELWKLYGIHVKIPFTYYPLTDSQAEQNHCTIE